MKNEDDNNDYCRHKYQLPVLACEYSCLLLLLAIGMFCKRECALFWPQKFIQ